MSAIRADEVVGTRSAEIGDSDLPPAPPSGGSGLAAALSAAIQETGGNLLRAFLDVVAQDGRSPLRGRQPGDVIATNGCIHLADDPAIGETYIGSLARHGLDGLSADGTATPDPAAAGVAPAGAFAARFVEVRIDEELGLMRIARIVSAVDAGRILNEKRPAARSSEPP